MGLEVDTKIKPFTAEVTNVLVFGVNPADVALQGYLVAKRDLAVGTFQRHFVRVGAHMSGKIVNM